MGQTHDDYMTWKKKEKRGRQKRSIPPPLLPFDLCVIKYTCSDVQSRSESLIFSEVTTQLYVQSGTKLSTIFVFCWQIKTKKNSYSIKEKVSSLVLWDKVWREEWDWVIPIIKKSMTHFTTTVQGNHKNAIKNWESQKCDKKLGITKMW